MSKTIFTRPFLIMEVKLSYKSVCLSVVLTVGLSKFPKTADSCTSMFLSEHLLLILADQIENMRISHSLRVSDLSGLTSMPIHWVRWLPGLSCSPVNVYMYTYNKCRNYNFIFSMKLYVRLLSGHSAGRKKVLE